MVDWYTKIPWWWNTTMREEYERLMARRRALDYKPRNGYLTDIPVQRKKEDDDGKSN